VPAGVGRVFVPLSEKTDIGPYRESVCMVIQGDDEGVLWG